VLSRANKRKRSRNNRDRATLLQLQRSQYSRADRLEAPNLRARRLAQSPTRLASNKDVLREPEPAVNLDDLGLGNLCGGPLGGRLVASDQRCLDVDEWGGGRRGRLDEEDGAGDGVADDEGNLDGRAGEVLGVDEVALPAVRASVGLPQERDLGRGL